MFLTMSERYYNDDELCIEKGFFVTCRVSRGDITSASVTVDFN
jgi:hypothetical protein